MSNPQKSILFVIDNLTLRLLKNPKKTFIYLNALKCM